MAISFENSLQDIRSKTIVTFGSFDYEKIVPKNGKISFETETVSVTQNGPGQTQISPTSNQVSTSEGLQFSNTDINCKIPRSDSENSILGAAEANRRKKAAEGSSGGGTGFIGETVSGGSLDPNTSSPLSNILPTYGIKLNVAQKSFESGLDDLFDLCAERALDALNGLDPSLRLQALLDKFQSLCGQMQFSQLRKLIDMIQQAKLDLIRNALGGINDPLARLKYLQDTLNDAINARANDLVKDIATLIKYEQFRGLIEKLNSLDPRMAIDMLNKEIASLLDYGKIEQIRDLLNAISYIRGKFAEFEALASDTFKKINEYLNMPEKYLNEVRQKILAALNAYNYAEVQALLSVYDKYKAQANALINKYDPIAYLKRGIELMNQALAELDIERFQQILNQLADDLCGKIFDVFPRLPQTPAFNPQLPAFLR